MKYFILSLSTVCLVLALAGCSQTEQQSSPRWGIVIHGGAGTITKENMPADRQKQYEQKLQEALDAGFAVLENGGSSVDAVQAAINVMEDSPLFNSGKGAVFAANGKNELDSSIMDGKTLNSGAVAGVTHIKNPINLARLVMEKSEHVMMAREGAEAFAKSQGMELVPESYFFTQRRWDSLQKIKEQEKESGKAILQLKSDHKFGTVGAAARDKNGNLAAGTSTGGMTNKKFGRIGDSPVIGAGTYANNKTCALSATGHGEYFIRGVVTYDISAQMEYAGKTLQQAADNVIMQKLVKMGGSGGIISIDRDGNPAMVFNTKGMFRGYKLSDGSATVKMFGDN